MPVITPAEGRILFEAAQPGVLVLGRQRLDQILSIVQKLHDGMQEAEQQLDAHKFMLNAFWLASCGELREERIRENPRVSDEQREDLLAMAQLRLDAEQWREHTGFALSALPHQNPDEPLISPV